MMDATNVATTAEVAVPILRSRPRAGLAVRISIGAGAAILLLIATTLPIWQATLMAPQYPDGLQMIAYGDRVGGDVKEINLLNHYIGMKPLRWEQIPERDLWFPSILVAIAAIGIALAAPRGWARRIACAALWMFPLGILADVQFRLYQYGHDLDEGAPLRIPEFTPWVVGPTTVWNFRTWARPGLGVLLLLLVAAAVTFGPALAQKLRGRHVATTGMALLVVFAGLAVPAQAAAGRASEPSGATHGADLQAVLDATAPGGVVALEPHTYHGSWVVSNPLTLVGHGATLHGDGSGSVLTIAADGVQVSNLAVTGTAPGPLGSPAGIKVRGNEIELTNISVSDSYMGVSIQHSNRVTLEGVVIEGRRAEFGDVEHALNDSNHRSDTRADMSEGRGDGISIVNSKRVSVRNSSVVGGRDGMYLSFASNVMLDANEIRQGRYAIHSMYSRHVTVASNEMESNVAGIVLMYGGSMMVIDNHLANNRSASTGFGLLAKDVDGLEAAKNVIQGNRIGVQVEGPGGADSRDQRFVLNTIALNGVGAAVVASASATFTGNSFVENHLQVVSVGGQVAKAVRWVDGGAGNYWSGYRGFDRGGDGVGDVPHRESGATGRLLAENPALHALLGSPALNLTVTSNQKWAAADGFIVDELPLMEPHSPVAPEPAADSGSGFLFVSLLLLGAPVIAVSGGVGARAWRRASRLRSTRILDEVA